MARKANIQIILESFEDKSIVLTDDQQAYKERILYVLELKLENLYIQDYELYKQMKEKYGNISFPQVCQDINIVERIIANEKDPGGNPQKAFIRYMIYQTIMKALELAEKSKDGYKMSHAANTLGKHFLTDKEDNLKPNYDEIIPFKPEISSDPRILGIEPIKDVDALKTKLEKKYNYRKPVEKENNDKEAEDQEILS